VSSAERLEDHLSVVKCQFRQADRRLELQDRETDLADRERRGAASRLNRLPLPRRHLSIVLMLLPMMFRWDAIEPGTGTHEVNAATGDDIGLEPFRWDLSSRRDLALVQAGMKQSAFWRHGLKGKTAE